MVKEGLIAKHNYKRAIDAIHDLEEHTKKCSLETPQMSGVPTANNNFLRDCGYKNLSLISIR